MIDPETKIVHHHAFKCGGSTLMWILEHNYPGRVLYVEGVRPGGRISCDRIRPHHGGKGYSAVSSHELAFPGPGEQIGLIHFSLLRDPLDRLLSAYRYQKRTNDIRADMGIEEFIETNFQADNFQARHASMPNPSTGVPGWAPDDRIFDRIESGEILFGLVEYFDQSMLLLEAVARDHGFKFDGAYPSRINASADGVDSDSLLGADLRAFVAEKNAREYRLYETVKQRMLPIFSARCGDKDLQEFASRCARLRDDGVTREVLVPTERDWLYIDA